MNAAQSLAKRILRLVSLVLVGLLTILTAAYLNPQYRNLRAVDAHLVKIHPHWDQFKEQNGYREVELHRFTGGNGTIIVTGSVPTEDDLQKVVSFLESTDPPRPLITDDLKVIPSELLPTAK